MRNLWLSDMNNDSINDSKKCRADNLERERDSEREIWWSFAEATQPDFAYNLFSLTNIGA